MMRRMTKSLGSRRHRLLVSELKMCRRAAHLTQRDLAAKMGIPQSVIAAIETGQRRVDVVEFLDWSKACGMWPARLLAKVLLHHYK